MSAMHRYTLSGLVVASEIPLPGLLERADDQATADVTVQHGTVPATLADARASGATWDLAEDRFLLRVAGVARYLIEGGREITVEAAADTDTSDVSAFILGSVMGILLHQRGQIVLHASATNVNGKAVLFCGRSGAGKSTLAAALTQHGFPCVTDDLCALSLDGPGGLMVHSDGRQLKLWTHAIKRLRLPREPAGRVRSKLEKYYVEHDGDAADPIPLGAIYVLRNARPPHVPGVERPNVVDATLLVRRHAYRPLLLRTLGQKARYFEAAAAIGNNVGIFYLTRTLEFASMPECVAMLERHWYELGLMSGGMS